MYSIVVFLFIVGVVMLVVGFVARIGTDGLLDISANVASSFGLLAVFCFLIVSLGSSSELKGFFEAMCGGIPYVGPISDYGSLQKVLQEDQFAAAVAFMDTVLLGTIISLISQLPLTKGDAKGKFMVTMFTGMVVGIVSLLLLNYCIKPLPAYEWIVSTLAILISLLATGTIPVTILAIHRKTLIAGAGLLAVLFLFSKSKIVGALRAGFCSAIVYTVGIYILEQRFGSIAESLSVFTALLVAFGPVIIMIIGLGFILKAARL